MLKSSMIQRSDFKIQLIEANFPQNSLHFIIFVNKHFPTNNRINKGFYRKAAFLPVEQINKEKNFPQLVMNDRRYGVSLLSRKQKVMMKKEPERNLIA